MPCLESKGLSAGSIRKHYAPVRALLATAYEDGEIMSAPTVRVIVQDDTPRRRPPTPMREDFAKLVNPGNRAAP